MNYFKGKHRARIEKEMSAARSRRQAVGCPAPVQESDEFVCRRCFKRWDIHDDKPACDQAIAE